MERKSPQFNIILASLAVLATGSLVWAGSRLTFERLDPGLAALFLVAVVVGPYVRSQIKQVEMELILVNALVIFCSFTYGPTISVITAASALLTAGSLFKVMGGEIKFPDIITRTAAGTIGAAAAWQAVTALFGPADRVAQRHDIASVIWFVSVSAIVIFAFNLLVEWLIFTYATEPDPRRSFGTIGSALFITFAGGGVAAGLTISGTEVMSVYVLAGIAIFFGAVFWTYQRYRSDLKKTAVSARTNERIRAELAEEQIRELERYVGELEQSGEALQESHETFRHAAYHDALTGLPNRNYFIDNLKILLQQSREKSELNFAILLLDLNRFKTINDSLGHSMGDRLIKNVAKRLSHMVREDDMVARFSGDKFGIILTDLLLKDEATAFAERMTKRIAEPYTLDGRQVFTNVKIGIAFGNPKYIEAEDILRDADIAMYYAKDNNESYVIFDQKMHIRAVTRLQLETDLRFAIERKEFELYYQPIIGLANAQLIGFEALVRWNHPQRGLVPPSEFIPISESTGLIVPMTVQILHSACRQVAQWQSMSPSGKPLSVAVNLSGKHFAHPNLVEQINTVIQESGINPSCLKLELTESAVMENAETAISMLKEIKKTGVQISIDDFGTGYSSLSYLHRFPIDLLKVDRSFVSAMEQNTENGEIVRTVIALAKALNLKVVAEGIESIHQFHQLRILGCEFGQGYLFSKPLPTRDIEKLMADKTRWQNILPVQQTPAFNPRPDIAHYGVAQ